MVGFIVNDSCVGGEPEAPAKDSFGISELNWKVSVLFVFACKTCITVGAALDNVVAASAGELVAHVLLRVCLPGVSGVVHTHGVGCALGGLS